MSSEIAISVCNVSKAYHIYPRPVDRLKQTLWRNHRRFYTEFWALRDVCFDVPRESTIGIIGRNGSGKSTLLQIIAGILTPTTGEVLVNGRPAALLELGVGFNPEFTGRENVLLNGAIIGIGQKEMEKAFDQIAAFADIGEFIHRPVKTYSTGMYLRLAFAIVTQVEADVLLIDEILAVGDEKFQRKCYNRLEEFRQQGGTVLLVSHDTTAVSQICDQVLLVDEGSIVSRGEPKAVIDAYHKLLYDAENHHFVALNQPKKEKPEKRRLERSPQETAKLDAQAVMENIRITGEAGEEECYLFKAGEAATIWFDVVFSSTFPQLTAGIRIRTIQGVEVYGTSTSYDSPVENVRAGDRLRFGFKLHLDLCPGAYSVNCAIAERLGKHDMKYLDKRTDVLLFKVTAQGALATGIADLKAELVVSREV